MGSFGLAEGAVILSGTDRIENRLIPHGVIEVK